MEESLKQLLLKDLCARLPHGVIVKTPQGDGHLNEVSLTIFGHELGVNIKATERTRFKLEECKPYLRSLSSMTEEERKEYLAECDKDDGDSITTPRYHGVEWLIKNKFDYRGLIPMGLAIEAPEGMYN